VTSDSELDGDDPTREEMVTLGVIVDDAGVGVNDASSSGDGDGNATLEDNAKLLRLCVGVLAGMASGMEPTRLIGDDKYADVGVRCEVDTDLRSSVDNVYGEDSQRVDPSGE
jgi:hypothetical protein